MTHAEALMGEGREEARPPGGCPKLTPEERTLREVAWSHRHTAVTALLEELRERDGVGSVASLLPVTGGTRTDPDMGPSADAVFV